MQNPFETGHIKNYILLYASVVVIMILFFTATTLFHDIKKVEKKVFSVEQNTTFLEKQKVKEKEQVSQSHGEFKLLHSGY